MLPQIITSAVNLIRRKHQEGPGDDGVDEKGMRKKMLEENQDDDDAMSDTDLKQEADDDNEFFNNLDNTIRTLEEEKLQGELEEMDDGEPLKRGIAAVSEDAREDKKKKPWGA